MAAYNDLDPPTTKKPRRQRSMSRNMNASQGDTGTRNTTYNLISASYHLLQGAETLSLYIADAEAEGDQELVQFFQETKEEYTRRADRAKELLVRHIGRSQSAAG
jgi:hypothetical protein